MKKIKVLELSDAFFPTVDGVVNVVDNYTKQINKKGVCSVACPKMSRKNKYIDNHGYDVIRCASLPAPEKYRTAVPFLDFKLSKRIKKGNFDILHAHSPFFMGRFALKFAKKNHIPVVLTLHTQYDKDFKRISKCTPLINFALKFIVRTYQKADSVWTVSNASKEVLYAYGYKGDIEVVRNGTDYVYPANAEELKNKVLSIHNLSKDKVNFIFVGRMAFYKNIKLIADACKILKEKGKDFTMFFVGGGFELEAFKEYVNNLDINDNVIFTGNINDRELLQGYYLASDALVFPSTFDMASISKVEASAHKLPTIVVEGSCSAEEIVDNENGFLCKDSAESIAEIMGRIIDDRSIALRCGENAYKTIYRTWDMLGEEVYKKYQKIIDDYKKKR